MKNQDRLILTGTSEASSAPVPWRQESRGVRQRQTAGQAACAPLQTRLTGPPISSARAQHTPPGPHASPRDHQQRRWFEVTFPLFRNYLAFAFEKTVFWTSVSFIQAGYETHCFLKQHTGFHSQCELIALNNG